jgi:hypothetical protein
VVDERLVDAPAVYVQLGVAEFHRVAGKADDALEGELTVGGAAERDEVATVDPAEPRGHLVRQHVVPPKEGRRHAVGADRQRLGHQRTDQHRGQKDRGGKAGPPVPPQHCSDPAERPGPGRGEDRAVHGDREWVGSVLHDHAAGVGDGQRVRPGRGGDRAVHGDRGVRHRRGGDRAGSSPRRDRGHQPDWSSSSVHGSALIGSL